MPCQSCGQRNAGSGSASRGISCEWASDVTGVGTHLNIPVQTLKLGKVDAPTSVRVEDVYSVSITRV